MCLFVTLQNKKLNELVCIETNCLQHADGRPFDHGLNDAAIYCCAPGSARPDLGQSSYSGHLGSKLYFYSSAVLQCNSEVLILYITQTLRVGVQ